jgi:hypothetical protein
MSVEHSWELFVAAVCDCDRGKTICGESVKSETSERNERMRNDEESCFESHARPQSGVGRIGATS